MFSRSSLSNVPVVVEFRTRYARATNTTKAVPIHTYSPATNRRAAALVITRRFIGWNPEGLSGSTLGQTERFHCNGCRNSSPIASKQEEGTDAQELTARPDGGGAGPHRGPRAGDGRQADRAPEAQGEGE